MRRSFGLHTAIFLTLSGLLPGACTSPESSPDLQASAAPTATASPSPSITARRSGGARLVPAIEPIEEATPSEPPEVGGSPTETPLIAPVPTGDDATDYINQINYRRQGAGLYRLAHNPVIDVAAQHHAQYMANQPLYPLRYTRPVDEESYGPYFTGFFPADRMRAAGHAFDPHRNYLVGEAVGFPGTFTGIEAAEDALWDVDRRAVLMGPTYEEIGVGSSTGADKRVFVADCVGSLAYWTYFPGDGQRDIPTTSSWGTGYPVSVHGSWKEHQDRVGVAVYSFTLQPRGGSPVEADIAGDETFNPPYMGLYPRKPLLPGTTYDVHFRGWYEFSWSFTTR